MDLFSVHDFALRLLKGISVKEVNELFPSLCEMLDVCLPALRQFHSKAGVDNIGKGPQNFYQGLQFKLAISLSLGPQQVGVVKDGFTVISVHFVFTIVIAVDPN